MEACEDELIETVRSGSRLQKPLNSQKYRYSKAFADLAAAGNTHLVAIVLYRFRETSDGRPAPNNYIVTAYQKVMS